MGGKVRDLTGLKFGNLTAIEVCGRKRGQRLWACLCDCGKRVEGTAGDLASNRIRSCGCAIRADHYTRKLFGEKGPSNFYVVFREYVSGAKKRNILWALDKQQSLLLFSGRCFYCGVSPCNTRDCIAGEPAFIYNGIDRIDSGKSYAIDNCVSCCSVCNWMKGVHAQTDFVAHIKRIAVNLKLNE